MDPADLSDRVFGPKAFRVCLENVSDFVSATGDDPDRWIAAAPPGFAAAALFVVAPDLLALVADRSVLHGEQVFAWHRPFEVETDLQVSGVVTRVRDRAGVNFVNFDLAVIGPDGPVVDGAALFLVSGNATAISGAGESSEPPPEDRGAPGPGQVGASRADLVRYAAATRDWNPIHWDHASAVAAGVPGVITHGLLQASWAFVAAARLRTGDYPLRSARVRFRNPLPPAVPATLRLEDEGSTSTVTLTGDGIEYLSARIEFHGG